MKVQHGAEFGIHEIVQNADSRVVIDGRCNGGVIAVGDQFHRLYRVTVERTMAAYREVERALIATTDLKVTKIEAYGRELPAIEEGLTARLYLQGDLPLTNQRHLVLVS